MARLRKVDAFIIALPVRMLSPKCTQTAECFCGLRLYKRRRASDPDFPFARRMRSRDDGMRRGKEDGRRHGAPDCKPDLQLLALYDIRRSKGYTDRRAEKRGIRKTASK